MFTEIKFRDFRQQYPGFLPGVLLILAVLVAIDMLLLERQKNYEQEIDTLRSTMSESQRERGDALADAHGAQQKVKLELVRREAKFGTMLHLSLDVDSAQLSLMQEGAMLRRFPVRLGVSRSVQRGDNMRVSFEVTDGKSDVPVRYQGIVPDLFREGQGVVAEGKLAAGGTLDADTVLAKHDERYMPREVVDALKKSGRWEETSGGPAGGKTR